MKKRIRENQHERPVYRKLTRFEKECCLKQGCDPRDYLFAYNISESYFMVKSKSTGIEKTIDRYRRAKHRYDY